MKAVWETPVVNELELDKTMGGTMPFSTEMLVPLVSMIS